MEEMSRQEDVIKRLPSKEDEDEKRIVRLLHQELEATEWAKQVFTQSRQKLVDYFKRSLQNLNNQEQIHDDTQQVIKELAELIKTKIVTGENYVDNLPKGSPVIVVVNHLGSYKLVEIEPSELGLDLPIDVIHPFPIYYAPLSPVGEVLKDQLYEAHVELPGPLLKIQQAAGLIIMPPLERGAYQILLRQTDQLIKNHPNALITVFPEAGTSGKRNGGGPYDLEEFHRGAFALAGEFSFPILPVCQYFNPDRGFEIGVLSPIHVEKPQDRDYLTGLATATQKSMQQWLNSRKSQYHPFE